MRNFSKSIFFLLLFNLVSGYAFSQFQQKLYSTDLVKQKEKSRLNLVLHGSGFFNNNEFFGEYVKGYTLTGSYFQPSLEYLFTQNFSVKTGIHLLKYNGQEDFNHISPVFTLNYNPLPWLKFSIGTFNQGANLRLPESLYKFENQFTNLTGQGIKISTSGKIWTSTTWLDWRTFIESGDPFREEFIFGHSSTLTILSSKAGQLDIPFYLLSNHKGGQINNNDEPVETRFDIGTGMIWDQPASFLIFDHFKALGNIYFELSEENNTNGNAFLGYGEFSGELFSFGLGYFYQKNWDSILGQPLFFVYPNIGNPEITDNHLFLFKAGFGKRITSSSSFTIRFEGYYDTNLDKFQYTYGLHILLNEWIELLKRN